MKIKACLAILVWFASGSAVSADTAEPLPSELGRTVVPKAEYLNSVEDGLRAYGKGDYDVAFETASKSARWGDKPSQFVLGLMYLLGDGTDPDFIKGLAWLEVASEAPNRKWRRDLETARKQATPEELKEASELAARLVGYYGMQVNDITCSRRAEVGSQVKEAICLKRRREDGLMVEVPEDFPI